MSESTGSEAVMPAINAHLAAELIVEDETWPVFVWTIDHPAGRVLVDTGMIDVRHEVDDMSPTPHPENIPRDIACVINTHLHFDHCGGNRLFPGVPIHVQARELADARSLARRLHNPKMGRLRRRDVCRARRRGGAATGNPPAASARSYGRTSGGRGRNRRRHKRSR